MVLIKKTNYLLIALILELFFIVDAIAFTEDKLIHLAIKSALEEKWYEAHEAARKSTDPEFAFNAIQAVKIYNTSSSIDPGVIKSFLKQNTWLPIDTFGNKVERTISYQQPADSIIEWFNFRQPQTNQGKFILLHAKLQKRVLNINNPDTKNELRKLWRTTEFDVAAEEFFIKKYKDYLTVEDLLKKIEHLTWRNAFTMSERLINILPARYKKLPQLRLFIAKNPQKAPSVISNSDSQLKRDELSQYIFIEYLLKSSKGEKLALRKLLMMETHNSPDKWWKLRNIAVRNCLRDKLYIEGYRLAAEHNLEEGTEFAEAEWLAGWIAFKFLDDPEKASKHFERLYKKVKLANSKSKASYWLARSYEKNGNKNKAKDWFENTILYPATFYGQIAIAKTKSAARHDYFTDKPNYTDKADKDKGAARKIALFSYYLFKSGQKYLAYNLIGYLPTLDLNREELEKVGNFYTIHGLHPLSVELSKAAANKADIVIKEGYPRHIEVKGNNLPKSIYLALIRQESNFDQTAISIAGARGLMQLMPATASKLARTLGLPQYAYAVDANSNVLKGVTYFDGLYKNYNSFLLAIASYNAGSGNINKWIERYGDPRKFNTIEEKIDWIESIPFYETRNYVKKVFENFVIYNSMLSPNHHAQTIVHFLSN